MAGVEEDRIPSVSAREHKGSRFFDPHGPLTEGDFASAGHRTAVPGSDEGNSTAGIVASSRADVPVASAVVETLSLPLHRLFGRATWHYRGATARKAGALSCRQRLFSPRRAVNWIPLALSWIFGRFYRRLHCCCGHCPPPSRAWWFWRRP